MFSVLLALGLAAVALLGLRQAGLVVERTASAASPPSAFAVSPPIVGSPGGETPGGGTDPGSTASEESVPVSPPSLADVLEQAGDLSDPEKRRQVVERMREIETGRREAAVARARREGLPARVEQPDGTVREIAGYDGDRPVYFITHNVNAAVSTGAAALRLAPYGITGAGVTIGLWDGGSARASHREFASARLAVKDGSASIDHATHVAGTLAAAGVDSSALGMAPDARIDSYDWNTDKTEMAARAATAPGQSTFLYLSNHSYGYVSGWTGVYGGTPYRDWEWSGDGTSAAALDQDFGRYNTYSRDSDALAFSYPYFLMFRSAGNDRYDNPYAGQTVALAAGSTTVATYDSALHPAGDARYRGGFETIGFDALGKNVLTVGSVNDAVSGGARSLASVLVSDFSSWGPTDDGRIKPDVVANGDWLYSSLNTGDAVYGNKSGTSMATPNAAGTAALLVAEYSRLFPGGAMRSSTLKALLIHTADDLGNAGPDYKTGWGLIDAQAAADLLRDHVAHPLKQRLAEVVVTTAAPTVTRDFVWDGVSLIRATLVWTDPAGTATTTSDLRTARLRNNLELKITGPGGTEHLPYVMPFVGAWTQAAMDLPATTGKNATDNVEQVFIAAPPAAGVYRCTVTFTGTLANNQTAALLLDGAADQAPPPPPLSLSAVAPASALPGTASLALTGVGLRAEDTVRLRRAGSADLVGTGVQLTNATTLAVVVNLTSADAGVWDVVVAHPDGETATLPAAFTVVGALWSEVFDGAVSGWTSAATTGSNVWTLSTAQSHSPAMSYFAPGPSSKTTCSLTSPAIAIPAAATGLQFRFWHRYDLQSGLDGGRLSLSVDNGATWFDVTSAGSGAAFASRGYVSTLSNSGNPSGRGEFAGLAAWTGASGAFVETIVNLTDTAKYAGKTFRARWTLATNNGTASVGWYVDSAALVGGVSVNSAPTLATPVVASSLETVADLDGTVFTVVRGRELGLSVTADDDGGEPALTYTWTAESASAPPVGFDVNGINAARATHALFEGTGDYRVTVTVRDASGLSVAVTLPVRVLPVADGLRVEPAVASVTVGGAQIFSAIVQDQFGVALSTQPTVFGWAASGGGAISEGGLFTATAAGGPYTVTATGMGYSATAAVTVNRAFARVVLGGLTQTYDGVAKRVSVATTPAGLDCVVNYDGEATEPVAAGSYAVVASVVSPNYQGSAEGTLVIEPRRFALSLVVAPVDGGAVVGAGDFVEGTVAAITATAAEGWRFTGWSGAPVADATVSATTVTMDAAHVITATFERLSAYDLWVDAAGLADAVTAAPTADPDGDGVPNLLEYATGSDPQAPGAAAVSPGLTGDGQLSLGFTRIADPALRYIVEVADEVVGPWTTLAAEGNPSTGGVENAGPVVIADPAPSGSVARRFLRLRVEY